MSTTLEPVVCCAPLAAAAMSDDEATATAELFRTRRPARPDREPRRDERRAGVRVQALRAAGAPPSRPSPTIWKKLVDAGLLEREQRGKWAYFALGATPSRSSRRSPT